MIYREAVATSSPTLPLRGYVGYGRRKEDTTPSSLSEKSKIAKIGDTKTIRRDRKTRYKANVGQKKFDTQGSRGGNPGLQVATASR